MTVSSYGDLKPHINHHVVCTYYGERISPNNVTVECVDCGEILMDFNNPKEEDESNVPKGPKS